jgi:CRP/FNR family transcriptional regulator, cyclic AMP receptor protein
MNMHATGPGASFWGRLNETEQAALQALGRISTFRPGDTMCIQGEPATHVFVLVKGWVKILSVTSDGHEIVLALRGRGDIVGELAGEFTGYRTATVRAIDLVRSLIIGHDSFSSYLDSNPGASRAYRYAVMQSWNDAAEILRSRWVSSGAQRLAAVLLDLAYRHGTATQNGISIALPLTQEEIASLIGASRATVTRALRDWRRRGLIRTRQRNITIMDVTGLRRIAGREAG